MQSTLGDQAMCRFFTRNGGGSTYRTQIRRFGMLSLFGAFVFVAAAPAITQEDDPDGLLVPPGLETIAESPPADDEIPEADTPRTDLADDVETEIVGKVLSVEDRVITIRDADDRTRKFRVANGARVELDEKRVRLEDLRAGDVVRLQTGGDPDSALAVRAVTPPPSSDREPDEQLRQRRQDEVQTEDGAQGQQRMQSQRQQVGTPQGGGRVWMVMIDPEGGAAESGMRPGDVILIVDNKMVQSENVLNRFNLPSGLFPLQANASGEVFIGPNGAGVGIVGPGGVLVPTGVNLQNGGFGVNTNPNGFGTGDGRQAPRNDNSFGPPIGGGQNPADRSFGPPIGGGQNPGDRNFGPPIGGRPNPADRNFGPPIGTGNSATPQTPATPSPSGTQAAPGASGAGAGGAGAAGGAGGAGAGTN
jgi:hypothetical protein